MHEHQSYFEYLSNAETFCIFKIPVYFNKIASVKNIRLSNFQLYCKIDIKNISYL